MKFNRCIAIIAAVFLIAVSGLATADVLPGPVPENQLFTTQSIIDAVGVTTESTSLVWQIGDRGLNRLPNATVNAAGNAIRSGSIAYVTYKDDITTNGGQISEVKSFAMDTRGKTPGMFNVETKKVLTYTSQNGSSLMGSESYFLDVAGNWSAGNEGIVCVFSRGNQDTIPAFCNVVSASSTLRSVTTAQVQTVGGLTAVRETTGFDTPAALNYEISVTPDANSASGYADGIVSTVFAVSVMEGRYDGNVTPRPNAWAANPGRLATLEFFDQLTATLNYEDRATVAGGISTFNKVFGYQSGVRCSNC